MPNQELPSNAQVTPPVSRLAARRALGRREDLDLDFHAEPSNAVVTLLLARCLDLPGDPERSASALTLAARTGGLLAIYARTWDVTSLPVTVRCSPGCGETFEARLPLDPLLAIAEASERTPVVDAPGAGGTPIRVRRPTGDDQARWQAQRYGSPVDARAAVLASLLEDAAVDAAPHLAALDAAMEEADPLPAFRVSARCPACGAENDRAVDLEAVLLERFESRQRALLRQVHGLASRYGWTEAEVLALPEWRRREYLRLLDGEGAE